MKHLILTTLTLISSISMACPLIEGHYNSCTTGDAQTDIMIDLPATYNIVQKKLNTGKTEFTFSDGVEVDTMIEGKTYSDVDPELGKSKAVLSCSTDTVIINHESEVIIDEDDPEMNLLIKGATETRLIGNDLIMTEKVFAEDGSDEEFITITCKK